MRVWLSRMVYLMLLTAGLPAHATVVQVELKGVVAHVPGDDGPALAVGMPLAMRFTYDSAQQPDFEFGGPNFAEYWNPILSLDLEVGDFKAGLAPNEFSFIDIFNDVQHSDFYSDSFTMVVGLHSRPVEGWRTLFVHLGLGTEADAPPVSLMTRRLPHPFPSLEVWQGGTAWVGFVDGQGRENFIGYDVISISSSIPEPAEWVLMVAGLFGVVYRLRWRAKAVRGATLKRPGANGCRFR